MNDYDYRKIDSLFHSRIRLAATSLLYHDGSADFNWLKTQTGATDGNLTTHLRKMEEAHYIKVVKSFMGKKPHTEYSLTDKGRKAFEKYIKRLELLIQPNQNTGSNV